MKASEGGRKPEGKHLILSVIESDLVQVEPQSAFGPSITSVEQSGGGVKTVVSGPNTTRARYVDIAVVLKRSQGSQAKAPLAHQLEFRNGLRTNPRYRILCVGNWQRSGEVKR